MNLPLGSAKLENSNTAIASMPQYCADAVAGKKQRLLCSRASFDVGKEEAVSRSGVERYRTSDETLVMSANGQRTQEIPAEITSTQFKTRLVFR